MGAVRLILSLVAGLGVMVAVVTVLSWLVAADEPTALRSDDSVAGVFEAWFERRRAPRTDFERVPNGAIVPVAKVPDLLRQCSRPSLEPVEGLWRPTVGMVADLESRLPAFLEPRPELQPVGDYGRQYGGVIRAGRRLIYVSLLADVSVDDLARRVVILCDGGTRAFGVAFDVETGAFSDLHINGPF